ncbi:MAG: hypothetical protein JO206_14915 [Solirubrobacterales bacterium]|nr:hypothetical protein [Solirubrobacterales bacterium]MBV9474256.1 hypothetical protein [Solirubrobacterales bacterium]
MVPSSTPGVLLGQSHRLAGGPRIGLRLARSRDLPGIGALAQRAGIELEGLELARLVRFHPRRRIVICATALLGQRETLVGVGEIDLGEGTGGQPTRLIVDARIADGLEELLRRALVDQAGVVNRSLAA